MNRNKSIQLVERNEAIRRRGESEYAPYMLGNRKSGSSTKLKASFGGEEQEKDWICARLIEKEVFSIEESSDFS